MKINILTAFILILISVFLQISGYYISEFNDLMWVLSNRTLILLNIVLYLYIIVMTLDKYVTNEDIILTRLENKLILNKVVNIEVIINLLIITIFKVVVEYIFGVGSIFHSLNFVLTFYLVYLIYSLFVRFTSLDKLFVLTIILFVVDGNNNYDVLLNGLFLVKGVAIIILHLIRGKIDKDR